jgi:hypothetical protein
MPKWIDIKEIENPGKKTKRYWVVSKETDDTLGYIQWYGPWRKYCFESLGGIIFEWVCMRDIADFIEKATKEHYARKKHEQN